MLLLLIEPKIDWNRLLPTIEFKNLVAIMIVGNFGYSLTIEWLKGSGVAVPDRFLGWRNNLSVRFSAERTNTEE